MPYIYRSNCSWLALIDFNAESVLAHDLQLNRRHSIFHHAQGVCRRIGEIQDAPIDVWTSIINLDHILRERRTRRVGDVMAAERRVEVVSELALV
jgi:hypothetical protein